MNAFVATSPAPADHEVAGMTPKRSTVDDWRILRSDKKKKKKGRETMREYEQDGQGGTRAYREAVEDGIGGRRSPTRAASLTGALDGKAMGRMLRMRSRNKRPAREKERTRPAERNNVRKASNGASPGDKAHPRNAPEPGE